MSNRKTFENKVIDLRSSYILYYILYTNVLYDTTLKSRKVWFQYYYICPIWIKIIIIKKLNIGPNIKFRLNPLRSSGDETDGRTERTKISALRAHFMHCLQRVVFSKALNFMGIIHESQFVCFVEICHFVQTSFLTLIIGEIWPQMYSVKWCRPSRSWSEWYSHMVMYI